MNPDNEQSIEEIHEEMMEDTAAQVEFEKFCEVMGIRPNGAVFSIMVAGRYRERTGRFAAPAAKCTCGGVTSVTPSISSGAKKVTSCDSYDPRKESSCEAPRSFECPHKEIRLIHLEDVTHVPTH